MHGARLRSALMLQSVGALALFTLSALGCAAKQKEGTPDLGRTGVATQTIQVPGGGATNMNLVDNVSSRRAIIDMPPAKAFAALDQAYAAMGIAVTDRDPTTMKIGNSSFRARRKIGDLLMTKIVDCGGDSGMPNAETYTITLSIMSQISPNDAGGSLLQTVLEGSAKNPLTNAANAVRCGSVGGLEAKLQTLVRGK